MTLSRSRYEFGLAFPEVGMSPRYRGLAGPRTGVICVYIRADTHPTREAFKDLLRTSQTSSQSLQHH